jgi:hypothetical protein
MVMIKVVQEWPSTAFLEPNTHVWERFIQPAELVRVLERHGLEPRDMRGISVRRRSPIAMLLDFRRRAQGKITFKELGQRLGFHESDELSVSYMGYAAKRLA